MLHELLLGLSFQITQLLTLSSPGVSCKLQQLVLRITPFQLQFSPQSPALSHTEARHTALQALNQLLCDTAQDEEMLITDEHRATNATTFRN